MSSTTICYDWTGKEEMVFYKQAAEDENVLLFCVKNEEIVTKLLQETFNRSLIPDVTKEAGSLFHSIVTTLQLFPVPVYASPLRALLDEALGLQKEGSRVLLDSFDALKNLCTCERIIAHMAKNPNAKKISDLRDKFIERIGVFSRIEGGLHKVFQMPSGIEREMAFIKETFFNTVNSIRVLEFTILDLLGVEESVHDAYATFTSSSLPKSIQSRVHCFDSIKKSVSVLVPPALRAELNSVSETNQFMSASVVKYFFDAVKSTMQNQFVYPCSNPGCEKVETNKHRFARCSRCKWVRYHDKTCQTAHWKEHKTSCLKIISETELDKERLLIGGQSQK